MNKGPRLYNQQSDEARIAALLAKSQRRIKEVHRVRRNIIIAVFTLISSILIFSAVKQVVTTRNTKAEVVKVRRDLAAQKKLNKKLTAQRDDLKDPDYVAKMIRYRYYYSKNGEVIYNIPENSKDK